MLHMSDQPKLGQQKLGTAAKIYGKACPNEGCDRYQGLVAECMCYCWKCGTPLKEASASVAVFR
jgi:hypothetical protein